MHTRCFLFDPSTETWPEVGGEGAELLSMREKRFESHTYISREDGTNPPPRGYAHRSGASCGTEPAKEFDGRARRAVTKAPARAAQTAAVL